MTMLELNQTLGVEYCRRDDIECRNANGSNFTFVVPLDSRFGARSVTLHFDVDPAHLQLQLCHEFGSTPCDSDRTVNATAHMESAYLLPVGYYSLSMYKIRVASTQVAAVSVPSTCLNTSVRFSSYTCVCGACLQADVCALSDYDQMADYWLTFYRVRDDTCEVP